MIVEWLVPVAAFWMIGGMYLGGAPIAIEGGGAVRQLGGLLASFALFLVAWVGLRALLAMVVGGTLNIVFATVAAAVLLPLLCRLGFLVFGVKIRGARAGHGAAH